MRKIFLILLTLFSITSFAQPLVLRAGPANTVADYNLKALRSMLLPRYRDTTLANQTQKLDSAGSIISTYDNKLWKRSLNPKRWEEIAGSSGSGSATDTANLSARVTTTVTAVNNLQTTKQATLVSGTNLKTINGNSLLGSGDLVISGGSGSTLTNVGTGYAVGVAGTNNVKRLAASFGVTIDSSTSNTVTFKVDTTVIQPRLDTVITDPVVSTLKTSLDTVTVTKLSGTANKFGVGQVAGQRDGLLSGGVVTWVGNLTFHVSPALYYINNTLYSFAGGDITLLTANPTQPRIDLIALNTSGAVVSITGTATSSPSQPQADPSTQLGLAPVYIPAASTTPAASPT
jgi:hypothetical protein